MAFGSFFVSYLLFFAFLIFIAMIFFLVVWGDWATHPSTGGVVLATPC